MYRPEEDTSRHNGRIRGSDRDKYCREDDAHLQSLPGLHYGRDVKHVPLEDAPTILQSEAHYFSLGTKAFFGNLLLATFDSVDAVLNSTLDYATALYRHLPGSKLRIAILPRWIGILPGSLMEHHFSQEA